MLISSTENSSTLIVSSLAEDSLTLPRPICFQYEKSIRNFISVQNFIEIVQETKALGALVQLWEKTYINKSKDIKL